MAADGGTRRSWRRCWPTSASRSPSSSRSLLTGISSMLAEAIHSVADAGNQVLLLVGGKRARRARRPRSTRSATAASATSTRSSSRSCCSRVGGLFALYEAYHKFHEIHDGSPRGPSSGWWRGSRIVVLVVAIVLESFSFRTAIIETNKVRGEASFADVHPAGEGARAAGDPARGLRRADRPGLRAARCRADA